MNKYIKENKKKFRGYETLILAFVVLAISIIIVFNIKFWVLSDISGWGAETLGFLAKPVFVYIGYFAFMHLILVKPHQYVINKFIGFFWLLLGLIFIFPSKDFSGAIGEFVAKNFGWFSNYPIGFLIFLLGVSSFWYGTSLSIYKRIIHVIKYYNDPRPYIEEKSKETEDQPEETPSIKMSVPKKKKENDDILTLVESKNTSHEFGFGLSGISNKKSRVYKLPVPEEILDVEPTNKNHKLNIANAKEQGEKLIETLETYKINAILNNVVTGPSVTRFELKLSIGTKVGQITSLKNDIKFSLAAKSIRIQAPIPGKSAIGIEIPNKYLTLVDFSSTIIPLIKKYKDEPLMIGLGKDVDGNPAATFLDKNPHLLIAGATGTGKSVCVNTIIASILLTNSPDDVKLLLIDPKMVEFSAFKNIPHLAAPIITDSRQATLCLKQVVNDMENRFSNLAKVRVKNISEYNNRMPKNKRMPYLVVIIDELADLMVSSSREVEESIMRITQKARAAGIHLIVATQRPSTDVITGVIKSNIPSRISFAVSSSIDSRTILDSVGAESLLGKGDMLYSPITTNYLERIQGVLVSEEEIRRLVEYSSSQRSPNYIENYLNLEDKLQKAHINSRKNKNSDPLYNEVKNFVMENQRASSSSLQRKFSIGYGRAARLLDVLEEQGIVGPSRGTKPREVLVDN